MTNVSEQSAAVGREQVESGDGESHDPPSTILVSVRLPSTDVEALRLAAYAGGETVAHHIRRGVQRELAELRNDREFVDRVKAHQAALEDMVEKMEVSSQTHVSG